MNIIQKPLYKMLAANEEIIFVVEDNANVIGNFKVKFIAEVYVTSSGNAASTLSADKVATLKATPNNAGVGIFDFSRILEAYVSPDYLGGETTYTGGTQYYSKANQFNYSYIPHAIHQIDKFSNSRNGVKNFAIKFSIEYATSQTGTLTTAAGTTSGGYYLHNAVRQEDDKLGYETLTGNFGFDYDHHNLVLNDTSGKFLTNAPTTQYIGTTDYHTLAFFQESGSTLGSGSLYGKAVASASTYSPKYINFQFYYNGSTTGSVFRIGNSNSTGGNYNNGAAARNKILYTGIGTANIAGSGGTVPASWDYYTVFAEDNAFAQISDTYYFYNQSVCKGFEKFRLTWLNRLGVWDYFNFTKKNVRKVNSKRETYQQIKGSWNEATYKKHGYKGGRKTFSTNSKEVITLQTDYITEEAAQWLEELFTSPEVFVLQERSTDKAAGTISNLVNKYVQPCVVTTSSYTRKTTANDKLKQYTVDIEMSHNKRIQKA